MTAIIKAYCPTGTNTEAIERYMEGQGGYTTYSAMGNWVTGDGSKDNPFRKVREQVVVYECVTDSPWPVSQIEHAGRVFLGDNPKEQAFLATVIGTSFTAVGKAANVVKVYIKRKD